MKRPERVEVVAEITPGEFRIRLPDDYTGSVKLNCSTGTVVNFQATDERRPVKDGSVDLQEGSG